MAKYPLTKIDKFSRYLEGGSNKPTLTSKENEILAVLESIDQMIKKNDIVFSKRKIVSQIMDEFGVEINTAYLLLRKSLDLFGRIEYDGLSPKKVLAIRQLERLLERNVDKFDKNEYSFYLETALKILNQIHKIAGVFDKDPPPKPIKSKPKQLIVTNDPQYIRRSKEIQEPETIEYEEN